MRPPRLASLWRSSAGHLSLALRPKTKTTATAVTTAATTRHTMATVPRRPTQPLQALAPLLRCGYANDAAPSEGASAAATDEQPPPPTSPENAQALLQLDLLSQGLPLYDQNEDGHLFGLTVAEARPSAYGGSEDKRLAFPRVRKVQDRYDPAVAQLTRLLMRDGKLAKAQRDMAMILQYLQTAPPPKLHPARRLLPGHPPSTLLPLHPAQYLTLAIDSVAPLLRVIQIAKAGGGGRALPAPYPLTERQRRRTAFVWLLDVVRKRPSRGSGRTMLAHRIGEEVVAVAEGRSGLWDRREQVHRLGTSARANMVAFGRKSRRR